MVVETKGLAQEGENLTWNISWVFF